MRRIAAVVVLAGSACSFQHGALSGGGDDAAIGGPGDALPDLPADSWWDPAWGYRMPLTIANTSALPLGAGYQIGFTHSFAGAPCNAMRDEVRIVYRDTTELTRVFDGPTMPPWVWFPLVAPIPAGGTSNGDYAIYCANPGAAAPPEDPKNVFDFFDGFSTAQLSNVWTSQNSVTVSGGKLICGNAGATTPADNGIVTTTPTFTANHAVDFTATASATSGNGWWAGFQLGTADVPPWLHWWTNVDTSIAPDFRASSTSAPVWNGTQHPMDLNPHVYSVENYGMKAMYRLDDVPYETHVYDEAPPALLSVRLWNGNSRPTVAYDMVRVRQAVDPPPTVTVGMPVPKP